MDDWVAVGADGAMATVWLVEFGAAGRPLRDFLKQDDKMDKHPSDSPGLAMVQNMCFHRQLMSIWSDARGKIDARSIMDSSVPVPCGIE